MGSFLRYQAPAFAWVAMIFASSAMPTGFFARFGVEAPWAPKVVHVLFFFFLCFFLSRAFRHQHASPLLSRWSIPISILICLTFGILDEVHQMFVVGRHPRMTCGSGAVYSPFVGIGSPRKALLHCSDFR
jgi:hypothetical protein